MKKIYTLLAVAALTAGAAMPVQAAWNKQYVKIMLDAGHGGSDPGAGSSGYPYEHDLVLRCSKAMQEWLTGQGLNSSTLKLTRTGNYDVILSSRRQQSISFDPWVFCSVHLNAFNGTANGGDQNTVTGDVGNAVGDVVDGAGNAIGDVVGGVGNAVDDVVNGGRTAGGTAYGGVTGTPRTNTAIRNR